ILTWHYYPTQSQRCPVAVRRASLDRFLNPETLDEIKDWAQENQLLRNQHSPNAKLWLGETGPAQCGGQKDLSDRFVSSFWWLDQLGTLAQFQHDVVIRQTLIDSDYGMIDLADYSPRPDYW